MIKFKEICAMQNLKVALLQYDIVWENPEANFDLISNLIENTDADIFILPEMFSTGFTMEPEKHAEPFCGKSFNFLQQKAIEKNAVFTGSVPTKIGADYFNRLYWVEPNETFTFYDKRHLFSLVGEENHYTPGTERKLVEYKSWKLMPQICYDLRFPVWSRNDMNYDILFYVANWPEIRSYPWTQLLKARAIENLSYCIGVNRIGEDKNGIPHSGDSMIYSPTGFEMEFSQPNLNVFLFNLTKKEITETRRKFSFLEDRDSFEII